jgi:hypothetical protein
MDIDTKNKVEFLSLPRPSPHCLPNTRGNSLRCIMLAVLVTFPPPNSSLRSVDSPLPYLYHYHLTLSFSHTQHRANVNARTMVVFHPSLTLPRLSHRVGTIEQSDSFIPRLEIPPLFDHGAPARKWCRSECSQ